MKKIDGWIRVVIKLFNRCEQMKCLPEEGGILDQNERLMTYFDVIRTEFDLKQKEALERQARQAKVRAEIEKLKRR